MWLLAKRQHGVVTHWPGVKRLGKLLDGPTVTLTTTELERLFLPLALEAGLPTPQTQARLDGYRVDIYWQGRRGIGGLVDASTRGEDPGVWVNEKRDR